MQKLLAEWRFPRAFRCGAKEQFWRQAIDDWQQRGLSVTAFCQQRHLQVQALFCR